MAESLVFTNIDIEPTGDNFTDDVNIARGTSVAVDLLTVDRNNITVEPSGEDT